MILTLLLHGVHSSILALLLSLLFGHLTPWIAGLSVVLGFVAARAQAKGLLRDHPDWRFVSFSPGSRGIFELVLTIFVLYVGVRHLMWLLFPMNFGLHTLLLNNLGDLPLHIDFIRAFANGISFPPQNPIFNSEPLRYPYGIDLYNALWESLGVPLNTHLVLVGLLGLTSSLVFLRKFGGWWAIGAFFLNGGLSGWQVLRGETLANPMKYGGAEVEWKNLMMSVFIPQRGMLIALPIGLLLLLAVRSHFSVRRLSRFQLAGLGVVWGFLPFFHLHTFVVISIMMASIALQEKSWKGVRDLFLSPLFTVAVLPAVLFVLHSTNWGQKASVLRIRWGWLAQPGQLPDFLLTNFGPWLLLPLMIAAGLYFSKDHFPREERRKLWIEFGVDLFLFVLFFNVMLAPWEWDNIKVLIWPYLGLARLMAVVVDARLGAFGRLVQVFTFFFSGFVALLWSIQSPEIRAVRIYSTGELANVKGALADVPMGAAVFASATSHDHPLTYFGGMRVMGYEGHLWSHGIDAGPVTHLMDRLMAGDEDWPHLAKELGVTHIFWGPAEIGKYGPQPRPWMEVLKNVSRVPGYEIYAVKQ